jgi:hypothetical protein
VLVGGATGNLRLPLALTAAARRVASSQEVGAL